MSALLMCKGLTEDVNIWEHEKSCADVVSLAQV